MVDYYELDLSKAHSDPDLAKVVDLVNSKYKEPIKIHSALPSMGIYLLGIITAIAMIGTALFSIVTFAQSGLMAGGMSVLGLLGVATAVGSFITSEQHRMTIRLAPGICLKFGNLEGGRNYINSFSEMPPEIVTILRIIARYKAANEFTRQGTMRALGIDKPKVLSTPHTRKLLTGSVSLLEDVRGEVRVGPKDPVSPNFKGAILLVEEPDPLEPDTQDFELKQLANQEVEDACEIRR